MRKDGGTRLPTGDWKKQTEQWNDANRWELIIPRNEQEFIKTEDKYVRESTQAKTL